MNYTCRQVRELLDTYLDNMTNELQNEAIEKHLQECAECQKELDFLKSIIALEAEFPAIDVSDGFYDKLHQRLLVERNKNRSKLLGKLLGRSVAVLSAAAVITISVVSFGNIKDKTAIEPEFTDVPVAISELSDAADEISEDVAAATEEAAISATEKPESKTQEIKKEQKKEIQKEAKKESEPSFFQRLLGDSQKPREEKKETKQETVDDTQVATFNIAQKAAEQVQTPAPPIAVPTPAPAPATIEPVKVSVPEKVKVIAIVTAKDSDKALAQQMLSGCATENGAYVLSASQYQSILGKLDAMGASVSFARENKTARYAELTGNLQNGIGDATSIKSELSAIDNEVSKKYIILN